MPETVIKVENLSKQYRIGSVKEGYKTFRDTLVDAAKAPFQQLGSLFNRQSEDIIWAFKDVFFGVKQCEEVVLIS